MQVCRICFATDCKLYSMTAYKMLCRVYETLTGLSMEKDDVPQHVCTECSRRLLNCSRFRNKSLRSHSILLEVVKNHQCVTSELIQTVIGLQSSYLLHNETELDDLDVELLEKTNVYTEEGADMKLPGSQRDISVDIIKTENYEMNADVNRDRTGVPDTNMDSIAVVKAENFDIINQNITNSVAGIPNVLNEFTVEVKTESHELIIPDIVHNTTNDGEDFSTLHRYGTVVKTESNELDDSDDNEGSQNDKTHSVFDDVNAGNMNQIYHDHRVLQADSRLLTNKELQCNKCLYQTTNSTRNQAAFNSCNCKSNNRTISEEYLTDHRVNSGEKSFSCNVCNKIFNDMVDLEAHLISHGDEDPFSCNVCNKVFIRKSHLRIHRRIHTDEKRYTCKVCNKSFNRKVYFQAHLLIHTGEKPFSCDVCAKAFNRKVYLQAHLRIHTGEKPFLCNVCSKGFIRKADLQTHFRIHTGEKPYSCNVCHKAYKAKNEMQMHLRIHTGDKPYPCNICNKTYNRKFELQGHLRTHTGEKPFSCNVCDKAFFRNGELKRHLQIHSNDKDKPYTCNVCEKGFIRKADLQRHLRIHTGKESYS